MKHKIIHMSSKLSLTCAVRSLPGVLKAVRDGDADLLKDAGSSLSMLAVVAMMAVV